jgi:hypothetical protein
MTQQTITVDYTIDGVKSLIKSLENTLQISTFNLSKRAGLIPATLYSILKRKESSKIRMVRKKTIIAIAEGCGYSVAFRGNQIILTRKAGIDAPQSTDAYKKFANEIISLTRKRGRHKLTRGLQKKILKVIEVLMS